MKSQLMFSLALIAMVVKPLYSACKERQKKRNGFCCWTVVCTNQTFETCKFDGDSDKCVNCLTGKCGTHTVNTIHFSFPPNYLCEDVIDVCDTTSNGGTIIHYHGCMAECRCDRRNGFINFDSRTKQCAQSNKRCHNESTWLNDNGECEPCALGHVQDKYGRCPSGKHIVTSTLFHTSTVVNPTTAESGHQEREISRLSTEVIVAIVISICFLLILLIVAAVCCIRRRSRNQSDVNMQPHQIEDNVRPNHENVADGSSENIPHRQEIDNTNQKQFDFPYEYNLGENVNEPIDEVQPDSSSGDNSISHPQSSQEAGYSAQNESGMPLIQQQRDIIIMQPFSQGRNRQVLPSGDSLEVSRESSEDRDPSSSSFIDIHRDSQ